MTMNEYQEAARRTLGKSDLVVLGLGIAGEAGEVADLIKKWFGHGHPLDREKLKEEIGDCLWYLAMLAEVSEMSLSEVAEANIEKLRARYPEGFSSERSINRSER